MLTIRNLVKVYPGPVAALQGIDLDLGEGMLRRPILIFALPVALLLACGFFLWGWSPSWLDPRINQFLMWIDPGGFRWLNETWLKGDRGVEFYNHASIEFDRPFLISRCVFLALGLLGVVGSERHFRATLRGGRPGIATFAWRWLSRSTPRPVHAPEPSAGALPLEQLGMMARPPSFLHTAAVVAGAELRELTRQPGLYLFVPMILLQTIGTNALAVGAFQTPLLQTPGTIAVASMNTLSILVCLLLMFYTVESLERDRTTGLAPIHYAMPVRTSALLLGKALANSFVAVVILLAALAGCLVVLLIQGRVDLSLWPFGLVWGLLLVPTLFAWTCFVTACLSVTASRYTTYAIGLAALIFTGYRQLTGQMNWVGNWPLWSALHWSDMSIFELDRTALWLNRGMVLGLGGLFLAVAVKTFRRKEFDPARIVQRFYPLALVMGGLRLLPYALVPLVLGAVLWGQVYLGFEGDAAKKARKDYWRNNLATWKDYPLPATTHVDLDLDLEPARSWFHVRGTYTLYNHRQAAIRQVLLTGADHWRNVTWTLDSADYVPENHSGLYVFTPPTPLALGASVRIGFAFEGTVPVGITKNGGTVSEFILPSGVVLTSFTPSFTPVVGYVEEIGVDKDNRYESRIYPDDFFVGITDPLFGSPIPFTTHIRITGPEDFTFNSVGTLESDSSNDGRRTVVWTSDHPMRFFNVVGGRWAVRHGDGTAVFYYPGHPYNIDEMLEALNGARKYYSEWFYPYPWKELKLSEFPNLATYAQGFSTDITFSEGVGFLAKSDPKVEAPFIIAAHESAHQWWGNILVPGKGPGANILAEGMAHFSTMLLAERVRGLRSRIEFAKRIEESYELARQKDAERPLVKTDGSQKGDTTVTYRSFAATKAGGNRGRCEGAFSALMPLGNGRGGIVPPRSVVAPESALGSLASVALSSAQAEVILGPGPLGGSGVPWAMAA